MIYSLEGAHFKDLGCIHNTNYVYQLKFNFWSRTKFIRRKHIVQPMGWSVYSSTCFLWWAGCASEMGVSKLLYALFKVLVLIILYSAAGWGIIIRAASGLRPDNKTSLQSNAVSHWLGANLESALIMPAIHAASMIVYVNLQAACISTKHNVHIHMNSTLTVSDITAYIT